MISKLQYGQMLARCQPKEVREAAVKRLSVKQDMELEREMHVTYAGLLTVNDIHFIHAPFGRKSQLPPGWPDFTFTLHNRWGMVEFKTQEGTLTESQQRMIPALRLAGCKVLVTESVSEAWIWSKRVLEGKYSTTAP
jgi:hypothetical protein